MPQGRNVRCSRESPQWNQPVLAVSDTFREFVPARLVYTVLCYYLKQSVKSKPPNYLFPVAEVDRYIQR